MKRVFIRLAAEMAALAIFRPQVLQQAGVGGLAGGIFSGGSSARAAVGCLLGLTPFSARALDLLA